MKYRDLIFVCLLMFCVDLVAQTRMIPHITNGDDFATNIVAINTTLEAQSYALVGYDENGNYLSTARHTLAPRGSSDETISLQFAQRPAYVLIEGSEHVSISVSYKALLNSGSPAHLAPINQQSSSWRFLSGDWSKVWDGLAIVNMGNQATDIQIRQVWFEGNTVATQTVTEGLPVGAKILYVVNQNFSTVARTYFIVEAAQPIAVTALRGTYTSDLLWANDVSPVVEENESSVTYQVTFDSSWSEETHPEGFPSSAHYSSLVGATHNYGVQFWQEGALASDGIELMAETGATSGLRNEVNSAIEGGTAEFLLEGPAMGSSPGAVSFSFEVTASHPLVSLVSMLAPSPDWFVGVSGVNLYRDGSWVDELTINLYPYDSGTDSGETYTASNQDTDPAEGIYRIPGSPFLMNNKVGAVGSFTFRRQ